MVRIFEWTALLYLVLKTCQLLFGPIARIVDAPLRTKLRSGEPMLAIGVFGCAGLLTLYGAWYAHTFAERWYAYSSGCYAKLSAAHQLPLLMRADRFGSFDAAETTSGAFEFAEVHGSKLGIPLKTIDARLDHDRLAYSAYYARITANNDRHAVAAAFADLDRCLRGVGRPRGELLHP